MEEGKGSICRGRCGFNLWVMKIPWRKKWQLTPVLLPGEFHWQRSPVDIEHKVAKRHDWAHTHTCSLVIDGHYCFEVYSLYAHFVESFIINSCRFFSNAFSVSVEILVWFLLLILSIWYIDWFIDVDHPYIPENKSHLIMVYYPFYALLNSACKYFVEEFCIYVHQECWLVIFFSCSVIFCLRYQDNTGLVKWVEK